MNKKRFLKFINYSRASSEEFEGYQYPKPSIPFPLPTTTDDSDIENLTGTPARLIRG